MNLIPVLTIIGAFSLGGIRIFGKLASPHIHPVAAVLFMQVAMLAVGITAFLVIRPEIKAQITFPKGVLFAVFAGVSAALFDILVYTVFRMGGSLSMFTVVVNAGSIVLAVLIGVLFLKESLTVVQTASILVILVGIFFLLK